MIHITEQAAKNLGSIIKEKNYPQESGLRLAIEKGGCAGLQYSMTITEEQPGDVVVHQGDIKIFLDITSLEHLEDCTVDYEDELTGSGFRIINPQAVRSCGCGTSFQPKKPNL
jgi:iron-sulfur cluster assembly protein